MAASVYIMYTPDAISIHRDAYRCHNYWFLNNMHIRSCEVGHKDGRTQ